MHVVNGKTQVEAVFKTSDKIDYNQGGN